MYTLVLFALLGWCAYASSSVTYYSLDQADDHFELFMQEYNKTYDTEQEKQTRFEIFKQNLVEANQRNKRSKNAVFGVTKFMDLTVTEFRSRYTGFTLGPDPLCPMADISNLGQVQSPDSFDWRDHGAVTRVKDQAKCNGCWSFSTTGNVEGQYAIKHNQLQEFSEQQLLDCETTYSQGCNGGDMGGAMLMLMKEGGSESEQDYPFIGQQGQTGQCSFDASRVIAKVTGCYSYDLQSEDQLKDIVYQTGPMSIGIKASDLHKYQNRVLHANECNDGPLDHAVLLVGYGTDENGTPYWLVKNSWGENWGEQGYFRIERGTNTCGLMNNGMAMSVVA